MLPFQLLLSHAHSSLVIHLWNRPTSETRLLWFKFQPSIIKQTHSRVFLFLPYWNLLIEHFFRMNSRWFWILQLWRACKSIWSFSKDSCSTLPLKISFNSSANSKAIDEKTTVGRSFMYIKKSNGPNTDPCGTPDVTVRSFDNWSPIRTFCALPNK